MWCSISYTTQIVLIADLKPFLKRMPSFLVGVYVKHSILICPNQVAQGTVLNTTTILLEKLLRAQQLTKVLSESYE